MCPLLFTSCLHVQRLTQNMEVGNSVIVSTADDVDDCITAHEKANNAKFIRESSTKEFGSNDWLSRCDNRHVLWNRGHRAAVDTGCSVPYMSVGRLVLTCDSFYKRLSKTAGDVLIDDHNSQPSKTPFIQSPKSECCAKVFCDEIVSFPRFKIESDTAFRRWQASNALKAAIARHEKMPDAVRHFEITFRAKRAHESHCTGPTSDRVEVQNATVELGQGQDAVIVLSSDESENEENNDNDLETGDFYLNSVTDDVEREIEEFYGIARAEETGQRLLLAADKLFGVTKRCPYNESSPSSIADCGAVSRVSESTTAVESRTSLHAVANPKGNEENYIATNAYQESFDETGAGGMTLHIDKVYSLLDGCKVKTANASTNHVGAVGRGLPSERFSLVDVDPKKRVNRCPAFTCIYCGQLFRPKKLLANHVLLHTEEQPFRCLLCNKSYRGFGMRCRCAGAPFDEFSCQCTLCGKKFYTWKQLTNHVMADLLKRPDKYGLSTFWKKKKTTTKKKKARQLPAAADSDAVDSKCSRDCKCLALGRESNGQPAAAAVAFSTMELEFSDSESDIMYI